MGVEGHLIIRLEAIFSPIWVVCFSVVRVFRASCKISGCADCNFLPFPLTDKARPAQELLVEGLGFRLRHAGFRG